MKNGATTKLYPLGMVIGEYKRLFGRDIDLFTVADLSPIVIRSVGNLYMGTYSLKDVIEDYHVALPCDSFIIKSVTVNEQYDNTKMVSHNRDSEVNGIQGDTSPVEFVNEFNEFGEYTGRVEFLNMVSNPLDIVRKYNENVIGKPRGRFIDYTVDYSCNKLKFDVTNVNVEIIYTSTIIDEEEGYPMVDEKTVTAIAYYINFIEEQKRAFVLRDSSMIAFASELKDKHIAQARCGDSFTQNQWNEILDSMTSWNRKMYNTPYRR